MMSLLRKDTLSNIFESFFTVVDVTFRNRLRVNSQVNVSSVQCIASFHTPITSFMSFFFIQRHHLELDLRTRSRTLRQLKRSNVAGFVVQPFFPLFSLSVISALLYPRSHLRLNGHTKISARLGLLKSHQLYYTFCVLWPVAPPTQRVISRNNEAGSEDQSVTYSMPQLPMIVGS